MIYPKIFDTIGNTPLVALQRPEKLAKLLFGDDFSIHPSNTILAKLEGNNPAGSVKDRAAYSMIAKAEAQGLIKIGDTLIEATSGNTGIALAMVAAVKGYRMILIMPDDLSIERRQTMAVYGAEIILTPASMGGMEYARDLAMQMQAEGKGVVLDQFANLNNPAAHYEHTAQELWTQTDGRLTHFVSSMGTTGTITGCGAYFKKHHQDVKIIGVQPEDGAKIAGIRRWSPEYIPKFFKPENVDEIRLIDQKTAENCAKLLAQTEGIFAGISAAGTLAVALKLAQYLENAHIAYICCDRGDRYLSTGIF